MNTRYLIISIIIATITSIIIVTNMRLASLEVDESNYIPPVPEEESEVIVITDENHPKPNYWFHFPDYPDRSITIERGSRITIPVEVYSLDNKTFDINIIVFSKNVTDGYKVVDYQSRQNLQEKIFPNGINAYVSINKVAIKPYDMQEEDKLRPIETFLLTIDVDKNAKVGVYMLNVGGYTHWESLGLTTIRSAVLYITIQ